MRDGLDGAAACPQWCAVDVVVDVPPDGDGVVTLGLVLMGNGQVWARNLKLELGYRYLNYGKFKSGASQCLSGNGNVGSFNSVNCGGGFAVASRTLSSNDFRIRSLVSRPTTIQRSPTITSAPTSVPTRR